ncbi:MAG: HDOD domain-containing protein [Methylomonas sp.]|nr:HDOD domain-containing protein [Methylomonas sp.]
MSFNTARDVVVAAKNLFSLPDIFFQLNEMIRDPRYSLTDIGNVISTDPALSARLLRIVNSAFYGYQAPIDTISRAITVVGADDFYNLVVATEVVDRFAKIPCTLVDMTSFWLRSVHCSVLVGLLAKSSGILKVERLFLAGLLHDIGSLVLYQYMPEQAASVLRATQHNRRLLNAIERQIIGFTHVEVGRELLKSWGLPASLYEVVGYQNNPGAAIAHRPDAHLLYLAVRLIDEKELGKPFEDSLVELPDRLLGDVHLNRIQLELAMEQSVVEFLVVFKQLLSEKHHH